MTIRQTVSALCTFSLGVTLSSQLLAQVTTASIQGRVKDESGAVVPGVNVTTRNLETGVTRTLTTDADGRYVAPNLDLGPYEVRAELTGFTTAVRTGINLTVGRWRWWTSR
jgi:hypothetical protein